MIDKAVKRERYHRLHRAGLWNIAENMISRLRKQIRREKKHNTSLQEDEAAVEAWDVAWHQLEPLCESIEKIKTDIKDLKKKKQRTYIGYEGDPAELLDPDYNEPDDAQRTRDAYAWVQENFRRVVRDNDDGTTVDFSLAETKPPTVFAVQMLEEYAHSEPGSAQRRALPDKLQQVLVKFIKDKKNSGIGYAGDL